jgi:site-specific DNA-methyltransferase (adenine-specific)
MRNKIVLSDNMTYLPTLPDGTFDLIYIDPPFNTGKTQKRDRFRATANPEGDRIGFGGKTYEIKRIDSPEYFDKFDDFISFIEPRLYEAYRLLNDEGSFFLHLDYREVHYAKVLLDGIFGRECFMNEIIWAYDYGARSKKKWPAKHDNILWYAKNPDKYTFNFFDMDRIPYMAPDLVGPEKAELGKTPTDVWWMTIVPTNSREKTGYPTQKPVKLLERIIKIHSNPGDWVLDFFAGSGTTGEAAARLGRKFVLVDHNPDAVEIMAKRLAFAEPEIIGIEVSIETAQPMLM